MLYANMLWQPWQLYCLGLAMGWQTGFTRHALWLQSNQCAKLRTPLLRLHAETLKLNPSAGLRKQRLLNRPLLRVVKPCSEVA